MWSLGPKILFALSAGLRLVFEGGFSLPGVALLVGIRLLVGVCVGAVVCRSKSDAEQSKNTSSSSDSAVLFAFDVAGVLGVIGVGLRVVRSVVLVVLCGREMVVAGAGEA